MAQDYPQPFLLPMQSARSGPLAPGNQCMNRGIEYLRATVAPFDDQSCRAAAVEIERLVAAIFSDDRSQLSEREAFTVIRLPSIDDDDQQSLPQLIDGD